MFIFKLSSDLWECIKPVLVQQLLVQLHKINQIHASVDIYHGIDKELLERVINKINSFQK